ncbi:MAG: FAD-dependent oxidoreductase [Clostridia bacterium]|nr:FAD-dependent oxidoreductase [Clostridia bacterium]
MKRLMSALLCMLLVTGAWTACAQGEWTPGTYTATAKGMQDQITVEVTLDDQAITAVNVIEQNETPQMGAVVSDVIPKRIVEAQSYQIDVATGATISSYAVISAVKDALKQADALDAFNKPKAEPAIKENLAQEDYDLVIVGGGGSGMSAAITAKEQGVEKVLVLEKLSYVGGSTALSGGGFNVHGTPYNEMVNVDYSTDEYVDMFVKFAQDCKNRPEDMWINEELIRKASDTVPDLFMQLINDGMPLDEKFWEYGIVHHDLEGEGRGVIAFGVSVPSAKMSGPVYSIWLGQYTQSKGAEIRLNSEVVELVTENGAVTGVVVDGPEGTYTVKAKKVILACGGIENNPELVAEYVLEIDGAMALCCPGNTGDFVKLTENLDTVITGYGCVPQAGLTFVYEANTPYGGVSLMGLPLWVNTDGERFVNENIHYSEKCQAVAQQKEHYAWGITDSTNPAADTIEAAIAEGGLPAYKADTLEELADQIGVPKDALIASIEKYNEDYAAGNGDTVFGLEQGAMIPVLQAPFYAQRVQPLNIFCMVSLKADDNCRILNSKNEAIENLYGTGEVVIGNCFFESYACSGSAVMIALTTGKIAALDAAASMQ